MARFNLDDYETVESRIKKFYEQNPDGRIITEWIAEYDPIAESKRTWVMKAYVYLTVGDQANKLPKSTGYAVEVDGTGGANNGSALENAETSAIGRALANMNLSGNKRASREEMMKVQRIEQAATSKKFDDTAIAKVKTREEARDLWVEANRLGAGKEVLARIEELARNLAGSEE